MKRTLPVFAAMLLACASTLLRGDEPGIVIYTTLDLGRDETAIAAPFVKAERFSRVTNVTTVDGRVIRVTNNMMKELVYPPDLKAATVVDEAGIAELRQKLASLQTLQQRFPLSRAALDPVVNELQRAVEIFEGGNVMVSGHLMSKSEYEKQMASLRAKTVDLSLDGVVYKGARLTSISDGKVSIMHAGGGASVTVDQLSDEQIDLLNTTSLDVKIDRKKVMASLPSHDESEETKTSPKEPISENGFFTVSMDEKLKSIDAQFLSNISQIEKELERAEAALPKGITYEEILDEMGRETQFLVKRKLDPDEFGYTRPNRSVPFDLYEIVINPRFDPELALLETTITSFRSDGMASLPLKRLRSVEVKMQNGFAREVNVYKELTKSEDGTDRLKPFHKVQELRRKLDDEKKKSGTAKEAIQNAEIEMREKIFPPRIYLSESLRR